MNVTRIALASIAAFFAYFAVGGLVFGLSPWMRNEFLKYPNIYRSQEGIKSVMPIGMAFMFLAIVVLAVLYAMLYQGGSGLTEGARFGALIGVFAIGSFVVHNYVNLQIGVRLTVQQGIAYFGEWVIVGVVIGLIYRPAHCGRFLHWGYLLQVSPVASVLAPDVYLLADTFLQYKTA